MIEDKKEFQADRYKCVNYSEYSPECKTCDNYGRNTDKGINTNQCYGTKELIFEDQEGYKDCIGPAYPKILEYPKSLEGKVVWYKNKFHGAIKENLPME
jgi:hypothetical protein